MPKIPGRESTKLKIPIERLEVASFFFPWERAYLKRECVVEGCDHRIGGIIVNGTLEICGSNNNPAHVMDRDALERDLRGIKTRGKEARLRAKGGPACICCVDKIMALG